MPPRHSSVSRRCAPTLSGSDGLHGLPAPPPPVLFRSAQAGQVRPRRRGGVVCLTRPRLPALLSTIASRLSATGMGGRPMNLLPVRSGLGRWCETGGGACGQRTTAAELPHDPAGLARLAGAVERTVERLQADVDAQRQQVAKDIEARQTERIEPLNWAQVGSLQPQLPYPHLDDAEPGLLREDSAGILNRNRKTPPPCFDPAVTRPVCDHRTNTRVPSPEVPALSPATRDPVIPVNRANHHRTRRRRLCPHRRNLACGAGIERATEADPHADAHLAKIVVNGVGDRLYNAGVVTCPRQKSSPRSGSVRPRCRREAATVSDGRALPADCRRAHPRGQGDVNLRDLADPSPLLAP